MCGFDEELMDNMYVVTVETYDKDPTDDENDKKVGKNFFDVREQDIVMDVDAPRKKEEEEASSSSSSKKKKKKKPSDELVEFADQNPVRKELLKRLDSRPKIEKVAAKFSQKATKSLRTSKGKVEEFVASLANVAASVDESEGGVIGAAKQMGWIDGSPGVWCGYLLFLVQQTIDPPPPPITGFIAGCWHKKKSKQVMHQLHLTYITEHQLSLQLLNIPY